MNDPLPFKVVMVSSEDVIHPAVNLSEPYDDVKAGRNKVNNVAVDPLDINTHLGNQKLDTNTHLGNQKQNPVGWLSAPNSRYPIEIGFALRSVAFITKMEILSHEAFIGTKLDIFIGNEIQDPLDELVGKGKGGGFVEESRISYWAADFKKIGYIRFSDNHQTQFSASERKRVTLNARGRFVKIVVQNCYTNKQNIYKQIGFRDICFFGVPYDRNSTAVEDTYSVVDTEFNGNSYDIVDTGFNGTSHYAFQTSSSATQRDLYRPVSPPVVVGDINSALIALGIPPGLAAKPKLCVDTETGKLMKQIENSKLKAIVEEDYKEANLLKLGLSQLLEVGKRITPLKHRKEIAIIEENFEKAKQIKLQIQMLQERRTQIFRSVHPDRKIRQKNNVRNSFNTYIHDYSAEIKATFPEEIISDALKSPKRRHLEKRIPKPSRTGGKLELPQTTIEKVDEKQTTIVNDITESTNSILKIVEKLIKGLIKKDLSRLKDSFDISISGHGAFSADGQYISSILGHAASSCTWHKAWQPRVSIVTVLNDSIKNGKLLKAFHEKNENVFLVCCRILKVLLGDKTPQVYFASLELLENLFASKSKFGSHTIKPQILRRGMNGVIPSLIKRIGEPIHLRIRREAIKSSLFIASQQHIRAPAVARFLTGVDNINEITAGIASEMSSVISILGRLSLLQEMLKLFGFKPNTPLSMTSSLRFINKSLRHDDNKVREAAANVAVFCYEIAGIIIEGIVLADRSTLNVRLAADLEHRFEEAQCVTGTDTVADDDDDDLVDRMREILNGIDIQDSFSLNKGRITTDGEKRQQMLRDRTIDLREGVMFKFFKYALFQKLSIGFQTWKIFIRQINSRAAQSAANTAAEAALSAKDAREEAELVVMLLAMREKTLDSLTPQEKGAANSASGEAASIAANAVAAAVHAKALASDHVASVEGAWKRTCSALADAAALASLAAVTAVEASREAGFSVSAAKGQNVKTLLHSVLNNFPAYHKRKALKAWIAVVSENGKRELTEYSEKTKRQVNVWNSYARDQYVDSDFSPPDKQNSSPTFANAQKTEGKNEENKLNSKEITPEIVPLKEGSKDVEVLKKLAKQSSTLGFARKDSLLRQKKLTGDKVIEPDNPALRKLAAAHAAELEARAEEDMAKADKLIEERAELKARAKDESVALKAMEKELAQARLDTMIDMEEIDRLTAKVEQQMAEVEAAKKEAMQIDREAKAAIAKAEAEKARAEAAINSLRAKAAINSLTGKQDPQDPRNKEGCLMM